MNNTIFAKLYIHHNQPNILHTHISLDEVAKRALFSLINFLADSPNFNPTKICCLQCHIASIHITNIVLRGLSINKILYCSYTEPCRCQNWGIKGAMAPQNFKSVFWPLTISVCWLLSQLASYTIATLYISNSLTASYYELSINSQQFNSKRNQLQFL